LKVTTVDLMRDAGDISEFKRRHKKACKRRDEMK